MRELALNNCLSRDIHVRRNQKVQAASLELIQGCFAETQKFWRSYIMPLKYRKQQFANCVQMCWIAIHRGAINSLQTGLLERVEL